MKSALNVSALVLVALMASARPAQANWWDWMQEWSGPGPFESRGNALWTACTKPYDASDQKVQNDNPCFFIDTRSFVTKAKDNFPVQVTANFLDAGLTWRVRRPVEIGLGVGLMVATGSKTATRLTLTGPRVVLKPVLLVSELLHTNPKLFDYESHPRVSRIAHILKFYVRGSVIAGHLTGDDLGVPLSDFDRKFEFVLSRGFLIDFGELLPQWSGTR